jgi:hypothetical protein
MNLPHYPIGCCDNREREHERADDKSNVELSCLSLQEEVDKP